MGTLPFGIIQIVSSNLCKLTFFVLSLSMYQCVARKTHAVVATANIIARLITKHFPCEVNF